MAQEPNFDPLAWASVLKSLYLELLPGVSFSQKSSPAGEVCDAAMVVAKAWEVDGTGSFIGEPLAADLLRAVAYRRLGGVPAGNAKMLAGGMIRRMGKRKILNHVPLLRNISETFREKVGKPWN